jgi:CheY-like chemotaxis protein
MNRTMAESIIGSLIQAGQTPALPPSASADREHERKALHVLIVEDHDMSRHCLERFLQKEEHRVVSVACAEDGLVRLEADHFDVLLADLHLPGMDGFELIVKAKAVQPSIRILMMTAAASQEVYERAQVEEVDALMEKPIEVDQLLAFLDCVA